ncbi:hypothetical protein D9C73_022987 [Collichthys lucidus]|uniref:Uncharacterized protein n=1 Tax=Collichthys lucidus TaxID=240159 RepID=A0A4V6ASJ8_COLLU|nr:hypothetical protein D9C73_022987 [Collichthys lucidus]
MDWVKIAVSFHILLCPAWAISRYSSMDGILSARSVLKMLDEPLRFEPCCLMSPPPPPLFPPPPRLWKRGSPDGISVLDPSVFGGQETQKPVIPGCSPGPPGPPGPQGPEGLQASQGNKDYQDGLVQRDPWVCLVTKEIRDLVVTLEQQDQKAIRVPLVCLECLGRRVSRDQRESKESQGKEDLLDGLEREASR